MIRTALLALLIALGAALPAAAEAPAAKGPGRATAPQAAPPPPPMTVAPVIAPGAPIKPKQAFRDCEECPSLVAVPPGIYFMGTDAGDKSEAPAHPVRVTKPFAIGMYEVTFDQWTACVKDGGCREVPDDHRWGRGRRPVINIEWETSQQYTRWLTKKIGKVYRLPSEAEWEYAARAGTTTHYPWGDDIGIDNANCRQCGAILGGVGTAPVGSFKPNPWGLYDVNGNVWEWALDCWHPSHEGAPQDTRARVADGCEYRTLRSGSWYYFSKLSRSSYRTRFRTVDKNYGAGMRVLRELP